MAKKKEEQKQPDVVTFQVKSVNNDIIQQTMWRYDGEKWVSNRQGVMSEREFTEEVDRMKKRDDVEIHGL